MEEYYKAYEKRYSQVYKTDSIWESNIPTREVIDVIKKYNIKKDSKILDLGCGEGRDARYLLDNGYNVVAFDYSISAINKCNELSNNKYIDNFKQFDLIVDDCEEMYDFIYSIAVIHMFVLDIHRKKFYDFIYKHLKNGGKCLIIAMGDGESEYSTDISNAFDNSYRVNINNNKKIMVANTSCRIKNMKNMIKEIEDNNFKIISSEIVSDLPNFSFCECFVVEKL